jgi:hypothetical protein
MEMLSTNMHQGGTQREPLGTRRRCSDADGDVLEMDRQEVSRGVSETCAFCASSSEVVVMNVG